MVHPNHTAKNDDKRQRLLLEAPSRISPGLCWPEEPPIHGLSYEWPTVYEETRDMLLSAVLMYGVVDLRKLAVRQKQTNQEEDDYWMDKLLHLPIHAKDVVRLLAQHRDTMETEIGRSSTELYLGAFDAIQSSSSSSSSRESLELEFCNGKISLVSFDVVVVEDELQEKELVYAICVDTARRRITVLFRGCSTSMDWAVCARNFLNHQDNPLFDTVTNSTSNTTTKFPQSETIGIHQGYCDYLFRIHSQTGQSKFDAIVQHVQTLLQQYPGYQVYVTGHSLGAALATVFAFQAAATQQFGLENVITCIQFASPMVGNRNFETAFRELEAQGRIRCLRVTNHFDIFTQLPDRGNWLYVFACCWGFHFIAYVGWSLLFFLLFQSRVYRHVGMDLHMYRYRKSFLSREERYAYKIKHSRGTPDQFVWRVAQDWKTHLKQTIQRVLAIPFAVNFNTNHSVQEHLWRLNQLSSELEGIYLKDLYDTQRFPGAIETRMCGDCDGGVMV